MSAAPQPPRPTLEDLLRFKQAERPSPEFWAEFDRGLRQKQLAALMKRPQGWARFRPALLIGLRWAVPASAAAAVALVVVQMSWGPAATVAPVIVASEPQPATQPTAVAEEPTQTLVAAVDFSSAPKVDVATAAAGPAPSEVAQAPAARPVATEPTFAWSVSALNGGQAFAFRSVTAAPAPVPASEPRRPRSSWTSRFNQLVQDMGAEQLPHRQTQLASFDLSEGQAAPVSSTPVAYVANANPARLSDRDFRDLESRFGVTGSSLSVKF